MTIRQRLQQMIPEFTPSERKLANLLSGSTPALALNTANQLAEMAGVSSPTVVRFAVKLGFDGFADFQRAWLVELESMFSSPLTFLQHQQSPSVEPADFKQAVGHATQEAIEGMTDLPEVIRLLADEKRRIFLRGGRFSHVLAEYMAAYLRQIRGEVYCMSGDHGQDIDLTLDIKPRDVLILFDYRRYQTDVMIYVNRVAECRAKLILFTDRWLSPAASQASYVFISPVEMPSPFDTMVPAMAQVEFVAKALLEALGDSARKRIEQLENLREGTPAGTLNGSWPMVSPGKFI